MQEKAVIFILVHEKLC